MKKALIIGGTSGLGLELANLFSRTHEVVVTGRTDSKPDNIKFYELELNSQVVSDRIHTILKEIGAIDTLVISAGFFQSGTIGELSNMQIEEMINVGLSSPIKIIKQVIDYQKTLANLLIITSTSQFIPRQKEPIYTTIKAGMGMLGASLSLDESFKKTFVVAPAGMKTNFWKNTDNDQSSYLDVNQVANEIFSQMQEKFTYRYTQIHRNPFEVKIIENKEN